MKNQQNHLLAAANDPEVMAARAAPAANGGCPDLILADGSVSSASKKCGQLTATAERFLMRKSIRWHFNLKNHGRFYELVACTFW